MSPSESHSDDVQIQSTLVRRSETIPPELEDPEDCTVGEAEADFFEPDESIGEELPQENDPFRQRILMIPKEIRNILAGGIAGMCAKSLVAPLDRIKILYQVSSAKFHFLDLPRVVQNIAKEEGIWALWKGNTATMLRIFPYSGIQFMIFERAKGYFLREHEQGRYVGQATDANRKFGLTPIESLLAGMTAGTFSVICTYPLDLTRAQLAVLKRHKEPNFVNQGFLGILSENYSKRGFMGLFRGLSPTLLGILPYSGLAFSLNEQGKREIQHVAGREVTTMERIQCGAFAGLIAQTLTYPIEVTRRRMQTIGICNDTAITSLGVTKKATSEGASLLEKPKLPSMASTVRELYSEQGVPGFFKGVSMNWMKGPVAFAISFTVFDTVQGLLESDAERARRLPNRLLNPSKTN